MHPFQRPAMRPRTPPVEHCDLGSIIQGVARDVDRLTLAVFRNFSAGFVVACPARIMRSNLERGQSAAF